MVALFTPLFRVLANSLREENETPEWDNLLERSVETADTDTPQGENFASHIGGPVFMPTLFQDDSAEFRRHQ